MGSGNAIEASFGLDLSPLKRDFAQAEAIGKTGAAKVQNAMKNASAAGARNYPGMGTFEQTNRAATARAAQFWATTGPQRFRTAANFLPASAGKYPKPGEEDEEGKGGPSLFSGRSRAMFRTFRAVALTTVAGEIIDFFAQAIIKAAEFREKIEKVTALTGAGSFRGIADMHEQLQASSEVLDEIRIKARVREASPPDKLIGLVTGEGPAKDAEDRQRLRKASLKSIHDIAGKQHELNDAEREQNSGSEERAAILKAEISHREKIFALAREAASVGIDDLSAIKEENARHEIQIALIRREAAERKALQGIESANLFRTRTGSGVTSESAKAQNIRDRLAEIAKEFPGANDVKRAKLSSERVQGQSELDAMLLSASREDPNNRMERQQKARKDAYDLAKLKRDDGLVNVHRDMNGMAISGTDPITGEKRNAGLESGGRRMDWELSKHMIAPGNMMPYAGSEDFNRAFGAPKASDTATLGTPGVLDRIEKNTSEIGANQ